MWRSWKTYLFGVPLVVAVAIAALFVWGRLQPRPAGYAPTAAAGAVAASTQPGGSLRYTADARDQREWVFFDFTLGRVVDTTFDALDWDVAFRRTKLLTNSGVTNPAGPGGAIDLGETEFDPLALPSPLDFAVDGLGGEDGDKLLNPAISRWYRYDFIRHVIFARPNVYLVRTGSEHGALVQFESYYCDDGLPGCITFHYRLVPLLEGADGTVGRP